MITIVCPETRADDQKMNDRTKMRITNVFQNKEEEQGDKKRKEGNKQSFEKNFQKTRSEKDELIFTQAIESKVHGR